MFYVLPTTHDMQCAKEDSDSECNEFKYTLNRLCKKLNIACIVEEYNNDAAKENHCIEICCISVANDLKIDHVFCDPDREERNNLGITDYRELKIKQFMNNWTDKEFKDNLARANHLREQFWLNVINNECAGYDDIIIVIGSDHEESFCELLDENDEDYIILDDAKVNE